MNYQLIPGLEGPGTGVDGSKDAPSLAPELTLGRGGTGVGLGGPVPAGRVGPGSWSGALLSVLADIRMIVFLLDLVSVMVTPKENRTPSLW